MNLPPVVVRRFAPGLSAGGFFFPDSRKKICANAG